MSPVYHTSFNNNYYYDAGKRNRQYIHIRILSVPSPPLVRLGQIEVQHELARNFYDDDEFCPILEYTTLDDRDRIYQRLTPSPRTSPRTSPTIKNSKRVIPIINPSNMTPISIQPK